MKGEIRNPLFKTRAFSIDLGRQPEPMGVLKNLIRDGARFHFNQCHLYVENKLQMDAFGPAKAGLTKAQVHELIAFAAPLGIEIVPILNLLGHTEHFIKHKAFRRLSENREGPRQSDQDWQNCLCPSLPETRRWAAEVVREIAEWFSSPNLHAGLDESWLVGSCPLCRRREKTIGLGGIFADYANFLNTEARRHGKTLWIAADMLFYYREALPRLFREIVMVDWYYDRVANKPEISFFNWRRADTTRILVEAGFKTVASGCCSLSNVVTLARYVEHLPVDSFLSTQWEGYHNYQDNYRVARCAIGHFLYHGRVPDWKDLGRQLLPSHSPADQQAFFLAAAADDPQLDTALATLKRQKATPLHRTTRAILLQRHVFRQKDDIEIETRLAAKEMLRAGATQSRALALNLALLDKAIADGREWLALLDTLAAEYGENKSQRPLYAMAARTVRELKEWRRKMKRFLAHPVPRTVFFPAAELVVEFVPLDRCAHACTLEVSSDGKRYKTVYQTSFLPLSAARETTVRAACPKVPRFVRLSIGGYARIAVSNIRCETVLKDLLPVCIVRTGGAVISPEHLLAWDQKSAIFNEPDVERKWSRPETGRRNFVELELSR